MANMRVPYAVVCTLAAVLTACASVPGPGASDAVLRQPQDAPARFVTPDGVAAEDGCRMNMLDPRDQTTLRLARSAQYGMSHRGDYEVPDTRYGVQRGELLRIDCSTGEVLGIVRVGA